MFDVVYATQNLQLYKQDGLDLLLYLTGLHHRLLISTVSFIIHILPFVPFMQKINP